MAHDREAETEAPLGTRLGGVVLAKALEEVGQELPANADAGVLDDDLHLETTLFQPHLDLTARGGELDRVDEQV